MLPVRVNRVVRARVCVFVREECIMIFPMVTVVFFCWLIPASPHACLTTQSSSLLASCPNQFICKQVCFFPLHPIVHTTTRMHTQWVPSLSPSLLLYSKAKKKKCFYDTMHSNAVKLQACFGVKSTRVCLF